MISALDIHTVYNRDGKHGTNGQSAPSAATSNAQLPPAVVSPTEEEIKGLNLHQRISWIIRESRSLPRSQWNADNQFAYAGHDQIVEMLRVLLGKYGVNIYQEALEYKREPTMGGMSHFTVVKFEYEVVNIHRPDDSLTKHNWGEAWDDSDKGLNKCSTISEKIFLLRLFKVATFDDPDSNSAVRAQHQPTSHNGGGGSDHKHKFKKDCEQCGNPVCGAQRAGKAWQASEVIAVSRRAIPEDPVPRLPPRSPAKRSKPTSGSRKALSFGPPSKCDCVNQWKVIAWPEFGQPRTTNLANWPDVLGAFSRPLSILVTTSDPFHTRGSKRRVHAFSHGRI